MASPFYFLGYILNGLFEGSPTFQSIELINPKSNRFFLL